MKMPTKTNNKGKVKGKKGVKAPESKKEPKAPEPVKSKKEPAPEPEPPKDLDVDPSKRCVNHLQKKISSLRKKKKKMDINKEKVLNGVEICKESELALQRYDFLVDNLQFAEELFKQFLIITENHEELAKKKEMKRIEEILRLQYTLNQLGGDATRQDFISGKHGAVVLSQSSLKQLDQFYQVISPTRGKQEKEKQFTKKLLRASDHLINFSKATESKIMGWTTTYKDLKDLIIQINECGYFEQDRTVEVKVEEPKDQETEAVEEPEKEEEKSDTKTENVIEEPEPVVEHQIPEETKEQIEKSQPLEETPSQPQPLNTVEQDAFFAPSSSPFQSSEVSQFSSQPTNSSSDMCSKPSLPYIQSFTHNRPFQFIQTSYVMPDANSPSVVDPAVIAAQPAGAHGLQFMSPLYDPSVVTSPSVVPQQQHEQQPQQPPQPQALPPQHQPSHQQAAPAVSNSLLSSQQAVAPQVGHQSGVNVLGMAVDLSQQAPVDLSHTGPIKQHQQQAPPPAHQEFNVQSSFQQQESLFPNQSVSGLEKPSTPSHTGQSDSSRTQQSIREESMSSLSYDIPPSIPMPPSQSQDPRQVDSQEKKSPMNANAPVFQSMYAQGVTKQGSMAPPSVGSGPDIQHQPSSQPEFGNSFVGGPSGDFVAGGDFQSTYQGSNGFPNGNYGRGPNGNRGNYRGSRGSGSGGQNNGMNNRNGGSPLQNGFGTRDSPANSSNSRGARGGNGYPGYGGSNAGYRSDSFQAGGGYGSSNFPNGYPKRGGMGMGSGNTGQYPPRPANMGGNVNRGGGMRGGMTRGGPRGGAPRVFTRPQ